MEHNHQSILELFEDGKIINTIEEPILSGSRRITVIKENQQVLSQTHMRNLNTMVDENKKNRYLADLYSALFGLSQNMLRTKDPNTHRILMGQVDFTLREYCSDITSLTSNPYNVLILEDEKSGMREQELRLERVISRKSNEITWLNRTIEDLKKEMSSFDTTLSQKCEEILALKMQLQEKEQIIIKYNEEQKDKKVLGPPLMNFDELSWAHKRIAQLDKQLIECKNYKIMTTGKYLSDGDLYIILDMLEDLLEEEELVNKVALQRIINMLNNDDESSNDTTINHNTRVIEQKTTAVS
jgi:hypothetical protein